MSRLGAAVEEKEKVRQKGIKERVKGEINELHKRYVGELWNEKKDGYGEENDTKLKTKY